GGYDVGFEYLMDIELLYRFHRLGATEKRIPVVAGKLYYGGKTTVRRTAEMTDKIDSEYKRIIDRSPCSRVSKCLVAGMIRLKLTARNCIYGRFPSAYRMISKVISR
ncbi:MAG: hypothetical protein K5696_07965, partial [Lachnospiraceae bacterium]|nr:hypothetical protein [Lachnospiraceae bacterium]